MKTILIDDERLAREELKRLLKDFVEIQIIGEAKNAVEGIQMIKDLKPDLVFLDVNMPGMTGFDMLQKLDAIPSVIFVTAYHEYALKAFEVAATDYITKPVDPKRLDEAIKKVQKIQEDDFVSSKAPKLDRSNRLLTGNDRIFIKDGEKCFFVELNKIRVMESDGNYVKVYFDKNRPLILRSLNSLEERLDPEIFFRANRKFIINLNYIEMIENWFNGGLQVALTTGEKIEISRRQANKFKEMMSI